MRTKNLNIVGLIILLFMGYLPAKMYAQEIQEKVLQEQTVLPYRAKAEFIQDTLEFMEYNFSKRENVYKGKMVSDVLKDLDLPVLKLGEYSMISPINEPTIVLSISVVVHQEFHTFSPVSDYYLVIRLAEPVLLDDYRKGTGATRDNPYPEFTQETYDYLKDMVVEFAYSNPLVKKMRALKAEESKPKPKSIFYFKNYQYEK